MQVEVLLIGASALCAALFPTSGGISTDESSDEWNPGYAKAPYQPYTREEELFIIAQLEPIPGLYTTTDWNNIAEAHKTMRESKSKGFKYDRTSMGLRIRFTRYMMKDKGLVKVPESIRNKVMSPRFNYHPEERKLINEYLLSYTGTSLHNIELWKDIKKVHDLRRESKALGFTHERTTGSLISHFYHYMKPKGLITLAVMRKFPSLLGQKRGFKRPSKAKKEPGCSQDTVQKEEENLDTVQTDEDNWADPLLEAMEYLSDLDGNEDFDEHEEVGDLSDSDEDWLPV